MPCSDARLALSTHPGATPATLHRLIEVFGSADALLRAPLVQLRQHVPVAKARKMQRTWNKASPRRVRSHCAEFGVTILGPGDRGWPHTAFGALHDPPLALFLAGRPPPEPERSLAIVGTRKASPYGLRLARTWAEALATSGISIVSGLARGIDGAAHDGAVDAGAAGAGTWAVLGGGVHPVYPPEHRELAYDVSEHGGLLSEWPPLTEPAPWRFPRRNHVVAALVRAVLVVEAPQRSGALMTASLAARMGRDVLAVPGAVQWHTSAGPLSLIRSQAAVLVRSPGDVLQALGSDQPAICAAAQGVAREPPELDAGGARLWGMLDEVEARNEDTLVRSSGLSADRVLRLLLTWEQEGYVEREPGVGLRKVT